MYIYFKNDMENTLTHIFLLFVVVFYFYTVTEKCNFLSIVIFFCQEYKFTLLYLLDQSFSLPKLFRESSL